MTIFQGMLLHDPPIPPEPGWVAVEGGRIADLGHGVPPEKPAAGDEQCIVCPGFVDAHIHLPQINVMGCEAGDLLRWLDEVVYPAETGWESAEVAAAQIRQAHRRMLKAGTLAYAGYLTSHHHGPAVLRREHRATPLRAIVGQSLMDREVPQRLMGQAVDLPPIGGDRLRWSVNPRFAVSCSDTMLARAGALAAQRRFVQTHLAESTAECALVRKLFPRDASYTAVYDRHGLLTERTLLAHCLHLSDEEWSLIAGRRSVVVHCPTANTFLQSGVFDLNAAREHGVRLALGSDVAAGPDVAMPRVARAMIETAKARRLMLASDSRIPTPAEVWSLMTRGNADALGFDDGGRLEAGAAADLLILRPPFAVDRHLIGRLIYTWRDEYIAHRILAGRLVRA